MSTEMPIKDLFTKEPPGFTITVAMVSGDVLVSRVGPGSDWVGTLNEINKTIGDPGGFLRLVREGSNDIVWIRNAQIERVTVQRVASRREVQS